MTRFRFISIVLFVAFLIGLNNAQTPQQTKQNDEKDKTPTENLDDLNDSLQDLIIKYRIEEQQKDEDEENDDEHDDIDLQRILKQIGVSLHKKYREKDQIDQLNPTLNSMIQQLYQTLKQNQPELFSRRSSTKKSSKDPTEEIRTDQIDENDQIVVEHEEEEEEEIEENLPLTPEMEHANTLFHQGMKSINVTTNRQYETAYKLFKQAAEFGHIGAKEELAFAHLIGVHLPMDFAKAKSLFDEGVQLGSPQSHYVKIDRQTFSFLFRKISVFFLGFVFSSQHRFNSKCQYSKSIGSFVICSDRWSSSGSNGFGKKLER